jgi:hypothetical protein
MTSVEDEKQPSLSKNLRVFLLIATITILSITIALVLKQPPEISQQTLDLEIQTIQKNLPLRVDAYTELRNIEVGDMQIKYYFIMLGEPEESGLNAKSDNFAQQLETIVKTNACMNKNTKRYIDNNVSLSYHYMSKDNMQLANFIIPAGYCQK